MNRYLVLKEDDKYLLERRKEGFDISKFTVVGSPTITDEGIASGFSASNYITQNITFTPNSFTEWTCKFTTGSDITSNQYVWRFYNKLTGEWCTNAVGVYNGVIRILYKDGTWLAYTCSPNTTYIVKVRYTSTNATAYIYNENKELLQTLTYSGTIPFMMGENSLFSVGIVYDSKVAYWLGSIDLKELSIVVDGKEVFTGAKESYYVLRR